MTALATVSNTRFIESGDKGISVGEDSQLVVLDSLFDGCLRGIESKDKSVAIILNSDVLNSGEIGVNAYNKNWRYDGGGTAHVHKCRFEGNRVALRADRRSRIIIGDSSVDELGEIDARRITVEATVGRTPAAAATPRTGPSPTGSPARPSSAGSDPERSRTPRGADRVGASRRERLKTAFGAVVPGGSAGERVVPGLVPAFLADPERSSISAKRLPTIRFPVTPLSDVDSAAAADDQIGVDGDCPR